MASNFFPVWQEWAFNMGAQRVSTVAVLHFWILCLGAVLLWAQRASGDVAANTSRAAKAEAAANATAAALRLQLNPYFPFNALNSIPV